MRLAEGLVGLILALAGAGVAVAGAPPADRPAPTPPSPSAPIPPGARTPMLDLQLDVSLHGRRIDMIGAFVAFADGRLGAKAAELAELGIEPPPGAKGLLALDDIPGLAYRYDEARQAIDLIAEPTRLETRSIDLGGRRPEAHQPSESDWGTAVDYTLVTSSSADAGVRRWGFVDGGSATLDARLFSPLGVARQTGIIGTSSGTEGPALRLDTTFTHVDEDRLLVYRFGDAISGGVAWTRPVRFGGVQIQRNFSVRPDLVTVPIPMLGGTAAVPSSVDIFVNDQKLQSAELYPGRFRISDLPVITGGGEARIVVRDPTGREVETRTPFYVTPDMLRPGLYDFSLEAGVPRRHYGVESFGYDAAAFGSWTLRAGVLDWLTLESHGEVASGFGNVGAGAVASVFGLGAMTAAVSGSRKGRETGGQIHLSAQTRYRGVFVQAAGQRGFGGYQDIASLSADDDFLDRLGKILDPTRSTGGLPLSALFASRPPRRLDRLTLGLQEASLAFSYVDLVPWSGPRSRVLGASWSHGLRSGTSMTASIYGDFGTVRSVGVYAGIGMTLGPVGNATLGGTTSGRSTNGSFAVNRFLDREPGSWGWAFQDVEGGASHRSGAVSYRSSFAKFTARGSESGGRFAGSLEMDGAVVATRDGVFASDRIEDAFAVVRAGAPGVEVSLENKPVGRTGAGGTLLVPNLRSLDGNRITIDPSGLPVDAIAGKTDVVVRPKPQSGIRVDFGVDTDARGAELELVDVRGAPLAVGRVGHLSNGTSFVVSYDGHAFVTGVADAESVEIEGDPAPCRADFAYRPTRGARVRIGPLVCR